MINITCLQCGKITEKPKSKYKFCNSICSALYSNKGRSHREESKIRIKEKVREFYESKDKTELSIKTGERTKGKYLGDRVNSILDFSSTTVTKVAKRLGLRCCICGWQEDVIDLHHIKGRKIEGANNHSNLCAVCPNHHRLIHAGKIDISQIISLDMVLPVNWLDYYYG